MDKKDKILILEALAIILLIALAIYIYQNPKPPKPHEGLLSQRVYSQLLDSQNHLLYSLDPLEQTLRDKIHVENLSMSVYIVNLRNGAQIGINEEREFDPLSINKLPIAILIMRKVERNELAMDTLLEITAESAAEGPGDLYMHVGETRTVEELMHAMLSQSDNTAAFMLLREIPVDEIKELSTYLDYYKIPANKSSSNSFLLTTPEANYALFTSLFLSSILNPQDSEYILRELTNTSFDITTAANLPADITVAQKYGEYYSDKESLFNSCGIIYITDERFFYCAITAGLPEKDAKQEIGGVVNTLYQYISQSRNADHSL